MIEGNAPLPNVDPNKASNTLLFERSDEPEMNGDVLVNEEGNSLGNHRSDCNIKVGGESNKVNNILPKNFSSFLMFKEPWVKIDAPFTHRLKKKNDDTKF